MGRAHVLVIPYPAQGHVIPMMELAQCLAENGIKVTFVNTELNHGRMMKALPQSPNNIIGLMNFASIPDGLEAWEERTVAMLEAAMPKIMPQKAEALIEKINRNNGEDKVTCVIADYGLTWAFELAEKLGIKRSGLLTPSVAMMAYSENAQKLIDEEIIDSDGIPLKQEIIQLSDEMPAISTLNLPWTRMGDLTTQKLMFHSFSRLTKGVKIMGWSLCNSPYELEPGALELVPQCVPIGPLLSNRHGQPQGRFWEEDATSLSWLDQQPPSSTLYVAFGSSTNLDKIQFQELALGLELTNRPFLWVIRQDMTKDTDNALPTGFKERIKNHGKIVRRAPQQKVLPHPSVSCLISHCGWNKQWSAFLVLAILCGPVTEPGLHY